MSREVVVQPVGMSFCSLLAIVFIVLKLCGVIAWSWWWVLSPLWIPVLLVLGIFGLIILIGILGFLIAGGISLLKK